MEVDRAISRGAKWLEAQQKDNGAWSDPQHPALSALALLALERAGANGPASNPVGLQNGYAFLRSKGKPDGGIYSEGLSNYNTALCVLALLRLNDAQDELLLRNAQVFLSQQQAQNMIRPELNGGIGYGPTGVSPKRQHPDLDNTLVSLEALRACQQMALAREQPQSQILDWQAAIAFVTRCQNTTANNPESSELGGFVYYPGFSNAGEIEIPGGGKALRSSGTMSYAGLLSFIYADLPKDDARVVAALEWLKQHFTLDENPGLGRQGLFYYYHLMAKALCASGVSQITVEGRSLPWARELALRLINQQDGSGLWLNDTGRWMEKDPVLVTSYALLTLELLRERL
jgi:squalene-hopene/tetraprenyl-beta-curcumene cyclase